jgi:hypothetical protein
MAGKKKTPKEVFEAILAMEHDDDLEEIAKMSDEEVSASIAKAGGDPVAIGAKGANLAAQLIERRERLQWQVEALEKLNAADAAAKAARAGQPRKSRDEMIAEVSKAQTEDGFSVALVARKGGTEQATDDELEELLMHIELLRGANGRPID